VPKVIGIIPSRYASRRFPGKALALLGGIPIIVRVMRQAQKSSIVDDIIVATDDNRIADTVTKYDGKAIVTKGKFTCGSERVAAAAKDLKADIVLNIQGDEPLVSPEVIDKVAGCLIDNPRAVMSTACSPFLDMANIDNPDIVKVVLAKDKRALYFSRSRIPWSADKSEPGSSTYTNTYRHIGVYGFTPKFLQTFTSLERTPLETIESLEQLRVLENGYDIYCVICSHVTLGIDTQEDLLNAEKMLESLK
jgi:3-deoxy-manno-octulosonate cytidylyltransferase (CMP-KDO synthetase)